MVFTPNSAVTINAGIPAECKQFNDYLATRSYVDGYEPSSRDAALYSHFKKEVNVGQFPHVARWHAHIASFSDSEREKWTGGAATSTPTKADDKPAAGGDDDFDLFGSEEEDDEEKQRITEQRLKDYAAKKSKKPGPIAKSNILYDVKPWDDTINIDDIEKAVRGIQLDGLIWGASKKVPVAFGLNKLQICCVVEDDKVSTDALEESICEFEDLVQSIDVVSFQKV
uniref:Elongation factor 1-beta n=1 Tax=Panagrolaimus superbus TaxID=310955 RepID=A0A914YR27_9BILA